MSVFSDAPTQIPSTKETHEFMVAAYAAKRALPANAALPVVRALYWPIAAVLTVLYKLLSWAIDQNFVQTCGETALKLMRDEYALPVRNGRAAQIRAIASGVAAPSIAKGTLYQTDAGVVYKTAELALAEQGMVELVLLAPEVGEVYNLAITTRLSLVSPLAGVPSVALVSGVEVLGADGESLEELRRRVELRRRLAPQGGSAADYLQWALEVEGVADIYAYVYQVGRVNIYVIGSGKGSERIPSEAQLDLVRKSIEGSDEASFADRRPLGCIVAVQAAEEQLFDVEIGGLGVNSGELRAALALSLQAYFDALRAENPALGKTLQGGVVDRYALEALVQNLAAAYGSSFDNMKILNNGATDIALRYALPVAHIATLRSLKINATSEVLV